MRATTYNKSEIMKQAWMMFNNKFYGYTFSQALKMAWYYAKRKLLVRSKWKLARLKWLLRLLNVKPTR